MSNATELRPAFRRDGTYKLATRRDKLAACISALRCITTCAQAYHAQGPDAVAASMKHIADDMLRALRDAEQD